MSWSFAGSVLMFLAVAFGAFGAHALKHRLPPEALAIFETGIRYHVYHALALFAVAWLDRAAAPMVSPAGWFFIAGIGLFSGSLYLYAVSGIPAFAVVTPLGGLC